MTVSGYALVGFFVILAGWLAFHLRKSPASPLDLVTTPASGRLSTAKVGNLVGLVVATWVVVTLTLAGTLSVELFLCYLAYVAGVDLFGKFLRWKTPGQAEPGSEPAPVTDMAVTRQDVKIGQDGE